MLTEKTLLNTDFILAKARCQQKQKWPVKLPKFHVFSVLKKI